MSNRILGAVLLVVGLILLAFGVHASDSFTDSVKESVTGRYTDKTMWYLIGGSALTLVGAAVALFGGPRASRG